MRERQVLVSLINGKSNKELAQKLGISSRTVQKHLQGIYAKLRVRGRTASAVAAVRTWNVQRVSGRDQVGSQPKKSGR